MNAHLEQLSQRLRLLRRAFFGGDDFIHRLAACRVTSSCASQRSGVAHELRHDGGVLSNSLDREIGHALARVDKYEALEATYNDLVEIADMIRGDDSLDPADLISNIQAAMESVNQAIEQFTLHSLPKANNPCTLAVTAGAGGADSEDWASMLSSMYAAHARRHGLQLDWLEQGPRTFAFQARGMYPLGQYWLEPGVHRLVRISPFNSAGKRHTSFAAVDVQEVSEDGNGAEVDMKDVEIHVFRASGAGGQHVNTTDSAVRLVHLPSGITVQCQQERSQHRNKTLALRMLQQRLHGRETQAKEQAKSAHRQSRSTNAFGAQHQVRSYVLHPYQQVKDHQTGTVTTRVEEVLGGGSALDALMEEARVGWSEKRVGNEIERLVQKWDERLKGQKGSSPGRRME